MKRLIQSEGPIVLYQLRNDRAQSRVKCLGYELAVLTEKGKVEKSWAYETSELRWAQKGYKTLTDAQARGVLEQRNRWRPYRGTPYNGPSRVAREPRIESLPLADRR
jgi:hypothetical protein